MSKPVHPIEEESYRVIAERVDLGRFEPGARAVVARIVHATADESFAETTLVGADAIGSALAALEAGTAVVCDSAMVVAGLPGLGAARCWLDQVPAAPEGGTRAAAAFSLAAAHHSQGALWVVGNAPTALLRLLELHEQGLVKPAAVIAFPVGYIGASSAKAALWASPLRTVSITNSGRRGGSPVAAAALNALRRMAGG